MSIYSTVSSSPISSLCKERKQETEPGMSQLATNGTNMKPFNFSFSTIKVKIRLQKERDSERKRGGEREKGEREKGDRDR